MYKYLIRPILFCFSPETIHYIVVALMKFAQWFPGGKSVLRLFFRYKNPALEREVLGIKFKNPIGMAAGFDKNAEVYQALGAMGFGFVEVGTVTPKAQPGNRKPRLFRLRSDRALINRMGLNNEGLYAVVKRLRRRDQSVVIGGNLGKNTITSNEKAAEDYLKCFRSLYDYVDYFVVNVSCPNVEKLSDLQSKSAAIAILEPLFEFRKGQESYRPILLKISPDLNKDQTDQMIDVLKKTELDGMVAVNTTTSREGLVESEKRVEEIGKGGLSGAPLTERAIDMVRYLSKQTEGKYPIIGVGGVMSVGDAERMLDAGASLVQVYTGFIYEGPWFVRRICRRLSKKAATAEA